MIEQVQDKFSDWREAAEDRFGNEPDNRNAGIGKTENFLAIAAALGATLLARNAVQAGWRRTLHRDPPLNPSSSEVDWHDALLWGAVSGAIVGMVRIASRRASSGVYNRWISKER